MTANKAVLDYASRHRQQLLHNIWLMGKNAMARQPGPLDDYAQDRRDRQSGPRGSGGAAPSQASAAAATTRFAAIFATPPTAIHVAISSRLISRTF